MLIGVREANMSGPFHRSTRGVTLIELLITIVVFGILMMLGVPTFRTYIANTQVRAAAEAVLNGIQLARAEAVRRNVGVQFQLGAGTTWQVCTVDNLGNCTEVITQRAAEEGMTTTTTLVVTPGGATTVTYNGLGRTIPNADGSNSITQVDAQSTTLAGPEARNLRVVVGVGGTVKMCDPKVPATDPRSCP
jgi:type IV fimbrial biogenesis protein FimT